MGGPAKMQHACRQTTPRSISVEDSGVQQDVHLICNKHLSFADIGASAMLKAVHAVPSNVSLDAIPFLLPKRVAKAIRRLIWLFKGCLPEIFEINVRSFVNERFPYNGLFPPNLLGFVKEKLTVL